MLGLLDQIPEIPPSANGERPQAPEQRPTPPGSARSATDILKLASSGQHPDNCQPCGCGSPIFWRPTSQGTVFCPFCYPPPRPDRVRAVLTLRLVDGRHELHPLSDELARVSAYQEGRNPDEVVVAAEKPSGDQFPPGIDFDEWWQQLTERTELLRQADDSIAVYGGRPTHKPPANLPPGIQIWHLGASGHTGPAGKVKDPLYWTFEGAPHWYHFDAPPEKATKKAK